MRNMRRKRVFKQIDESQLTLDSLLIEVEDLLKNREFYIQNMANSNEIQSVDSFYDLLRKDMER